MNTMTISVNNKPFALAVQENIQSVLHRMQFSHTKGIAVAVNNRVVPKSMWETFILKENDKLTIIRATQGG
jgi:sulfur carrier protein